MSRRRCDYRAVSWALWGALLAGLFAPGAVFSQGLGPPQVDNPDKAQPAEKNPATQTPVLAEPPAYLPPQMPMAPFEPLPMAPFEPMPQMPFPFFEYLPVEQAIYYPPYPAYPFEPAQVTRTSCQFGELPPSETMCTPATPCSPAPAPAPASSDWNWFRETFGSCSSCYSCMDGCSGTCQRFCDSLFDCLCRPDPCYVPRWQPLADSAFDVSAARPITQQGLRWDAGQDLILPDRSEYFWARANGNGPTPAKGVLAANNVNYNDVTYYFEAATDKFSVLVAVPYRTLSATGIPDASGLGDIKFGAKTLLFDCELLQVAGQFLCYAPTGDASKGLGTSHYSLEPSLLFGLRLGPDTYLQGQISEWIPIHTDSDYAGSIFHSHFALNQLLCQVHENCPLIATCGFNTYTFQDGEYTDPVLGANQRSGGFTYLSAGPGLRLFICDHIDFGFAVNFALTTPRFAAEVYTTEFRWRF
jgi:hypothetical protein